MYELLISGSMNDGGLPPNITLEYRPKLKENSSVIVVDHVPSVLEFDVTFSVISFDVNRTSIVFHSPLFRSEPISSILNDSQELTSVTDKYKLPLTNFKEKGSMKLSLNSKYPSEMVVAKDSLNQNGMFASLKR